jgi:hypothetical protein
MRIVTPPWWPLPWPLVFRWSLERRAMDIMCHGLVGTITQQALLVPEAGEIFMDAIEQVGRAVCGVAQGAVARRLREEVTGGPW